MADYNRDDVRDALSKLVGVNDCVFIHSNIGFFGRIETNDNPCGIFMNELLRVMKWQGSIFVPTFTYSFCNGEGYDRDRTPSKMGMFSEFIRTHEDTYRSLDPCYSVAGMGDRVYELCGGVRDNSFGPGSFFSRFHKTGGKILNFNFDAGSTFIHYAERLNKVDYRFDKVFTGTVSVYGTEMFDIDHTIYVRKLEDDYIADFESFDSLARQHDMYKTVKLGRGEIGMITTDDVVGLVTETLKTRPYFLTKGERHLSSWR